MGRPRPGWENRTTALAEPVERKRDTKNQIGPSTKVEPISHHSEGHRAIVPLRVQLERGQ